MIKKITPYIALIPLTLLALTPPWMLKLDCEINGLTYLWTVFISGFLAFMFLYFKVNTWLKLLVLWLFVNCFISRAPYMSFAMYWSVIACVYYYVLCRQIEDFTPVKKVIQSVFFLMAFLIIMQRLGLDTLLNFNDKTPVILGTIGNYMILGSFICVLMPFVMRVSWLNWIPMALIAFISGSTGAVLSVCAGLSVILWYRAKRLCIGLIIALLCIIGVFAYKTGDFNASTLKAGRFPVWKRTVELIAKCPQGHGIGTYKLIFPTMSQDLESSKGARNVEWEYENTKGHGLAWRRAHNSWLQFPFEIGILGFLLFLGWIMSVVIKVIKNKEHLKLAGLVILGTNLLVHFPDRFAPAVPIMIMFMAFCEKGVKNGRC